MTLLFALCMAVGLAGCAGLRAFLPLFLLGLAVRCQFAVPFGASTEELWLASDFALICFGLLALIEIACDMVPVVDHVQHAWSFGSRPLAGAFVAMSVLDQDPSLFWAAFAVSCLLGVLISLPVHTTSTTIRVISTGTTAGLANPFLSLKETLLVLFGFVAFLFLAPVALAGAVAGIVLLARWLRGLAAARRLNRQAV
jgi:hypothetical protein